MNYEYRGYEINIKPDKTDKESIGYRAMLKSNEGTIIDELYGYIKGFNRDYIKTMIDVRLEW